jgi:excisionase family DNA binding protein
MQDALTKTSDAPTATGAFYLRPNDAVKVLPISRRTLSNWQRRRLLPFYKIGRAVMFKRADLEHALDRFRVAAVGETPAAPPRTLRKRRAGRVVTEKAA